VMDHYWLDIRAQQSSEYFDIPRWHNDGTFFQRSKRRQWKLVSVILGPGTLFLVNGKEGNAELEERRKTRQEEWENRTFANEDEDKWWSEMRDKERVTMAEKFAEWDVMQPQVGDIAFFRVGDVNAAVHSEPKTGYS